MGKQDSGEHRPGHARRSVTGADCTLCPRPYGLLSPLDLCPLKMSLVCAHTTDGSRRGHDYQSHRHSRLTLAHAYRMTERC